jgi:drug/metabolite transporter (DMT)-like permease
MTVALSLFSAFAWTAMNYWLVPLSRTVDPYVTSFLILLGSGICTLPVALALNGVPGRGDLRPLAFAMLAGVL